MGTPHFVKAQEPIDKQRLTDIAKSVSLILDSTPECQPSEVDPARADVFTNIGEIFLYVATHYEHEPGKESHVNYFVNWGLEAFEKSMACDPSYANSYPSKRALWLIGWQTRWLADNNVDAEVADKRKTSLNEVRRRIVVPKPPECPECICEGCPPEPEPVPEPRGYYALYGGRFSLSVETGMYFPTGLRFGDNEPGSRVQASFGLSAGWRIPKNIHVFEFGGRFHHTVGRAPPRYTYPIGLVTLAGGYARYGLAPLQGKISIHGDLQLGMAMLPDHTGTVHIAPGGAFCVLEESLCLSLRYIWTPPRTEGWTTGVLLQLGADVFRIVDYALKRREK